MSHHEQPLRVASRRHFIRLGSRGGGRARRRSRVRASRGLAQPRPVTIVVPFTPGTGADVLARLLEPRLAARLKQPFVVENRPGASGAIGMDAVAKAKPDGYTVLFSATSHGTLPALKPKLAFDPSPQLHSRRAARHQCAGARGRAGCSGEDGGGARRARQGEARRALLLVAGQRQRAAPDDGAVQARDGHEPRARAVQGLGRRGDGPHRRARAGHRRRTADHGALREERQAAHAGGAERRAFARVSRRAHGEGGGTAQRDRRHVVRRARAGRDTAGRSSSA